MVEPGAREPVGFSVVQHRTVFRLLRWDIEKHLGPAGFAGCTLPLMVGMTWQKAARVLCLAPNEWLVVTDVLDDFTWPKHPGREAHALGYACVNISDGLVAIRIDGPAVRELLAKGCGLDFHPQLFAAGRCARTRFAQIAVTIDCRAHDRFELYIGRSYLEYLLHWLREAALA